MREMKNSKTAGPVDGFASTPRFSIVSCLVTMLMSYSNTRASV